MKPIELLLQLDAFSGLAPAEILSHPAWGVAVPWNDGTARLLADAIAPAETINLSVRFGDDACVLGIAPAAAFPELSSLFPARSEVPAPILLAVIEKEAGALFQTLENVMRRELSIQGLADSPAADARAFRVAAAGSDVVTFTLSLSDAMLRDLGDLKHLDCEHPSIADAKVSVEVEYAVFDLSPEEESGLAAGDYLLLPEMTAEKPGRVILPGKGDANRLRVIAAERADIPFSSALQDDLRCAAAGTDDLLLVKGPRRIASGRLSKLGEQPAFALEALC